MHSPGDIWKHLETFLVVTDEREDGPGIEWVQPRGDNQCPGRTFHRDGWSPSDNSQCQKVEDAALQTLSYRPALSGAEFRFLNQAAEGPVHGSGRQFVFGAPGTMSS